MNIARKFADGVFVVLNILTPVDFRLCGFDPRANLVAMPIFLFFFLNEALHSLSDQSIRTVVLAAGDLLLNQLFQPWSQSDGHFGLCPSS